MSNLAFRVSGLSYLDKIELEEQIRQQPGGDSADFRFEEREGLDDASGELVTTAIIVVGGIALKGLIFWLARRNASNSQHFKQKVETLHPDGRVVTHTVEFEIDSSRPLRDQILEHLGSASGLAIDEIIG